MKNIFHSQAFLIWIVLAVIAILVVVYLLTKKGKEAAEEKKPSSLHKTERNSETKHELEDKVEETLIHTEKLDSEPLPKKTETEEHEKLELKFGDITVDEDTVVPAMPVMPLSEDLFSDPDEEEVRESRKTVIKSYRRKE